MQIKVANRTARADVAIQTTSDVGAVEREKLSALVSAWRTKIKTVKPVQQNCPVNEPCQDTRKHPVAPLRPPVETWSELLQTLGYGDRELGWAGILSRDVEQLEQVATFLEEADSETEDFVCEEVCQAIEKELSFFSKGFADCPSSERLLFVMLGSKLEDLQELVGGEELSEQLELALKAFDQQIQARRNKVENRLQWRPTGVQKRVAAGMSQRQYETGQPRWYNGRLNDAPEMIGHKLTAENAVQAVIQLEKSYLKHANNPELPKSDGAEVTLRDTYFSQGLEPRVQFGELPGAPGVEGYLKSAPEVGPRVLELPLEDGTFAYLMFDGHHRAAAQILMGQRSFLNPTIMRLDETREKYDLTEDDILDAIRDLHTHIYMTDTPVPR